MSAYLHDPATRELLAEALVAELPDVPRARMRDALERAFQRMTPPPARVVDQIASGVDPKTLVEQIRDAEALFRSSEEWEQLVDLHVVRISACEEPRRRAEILLELAQIFEHDMLDLERALASRLGSFGEAPAASGLVHLERLARDTGRRQELRLRLDEVLCRDLEEGLAANVALSLARVCREFLGDYAGGLDALQRGLAVVPRHPGLLRYLAETHAAAGRVAESLEVRTLLVDCVGDDVERADLYREIADGYECLGLLEQAAEAHEWVIALAADDAAGYEHLIRIYRGLANWRGLVDTLGRRAAGLEVRERTPLLMEIARIYEDELGDDDAAMDSYLAVEEAEPGRSDVLARLVTIYQRRDAHEDALVTLERLAAAVADGRERAEVLLAAAEIAWRTLGDGDTAYDLLVRALRADADAIAVVDALAALYRERGEVAAAIELLAGAARRPSLAGARGRMLADAAELARGLGELDRAAELLLAAHAADPDDMRVALDLAEIAWQTRRDHQLVPLLESLCERLRESDLLLEQLLRLGEAAQVVDQGDVARGALARAVAMAPEHRGARRAYGDILFAQGWWSEAREVLGQVLDEEEYDLPRARCVEVHYRVGRCSYELSDPERARLHIETALALDPNHRPSLIIHAELDADDPVALLPDKLALANTAPPEERGALLAAIGDFYADEMGDNVSAREIYREALLYRPTDHVLLTKCLGVTAEEGDWRHSLELVQRLIDSEADPCIRARYHHVAAMICRDELSVPEEAIQHLSSAVVDDPTQLLAADELEALLADKPVELAQFYYLRLEQVRGADVREGEVLRLWDCLAEVCVALEAPADAACAYDVAIELDPDNVGRRQRLADIYIELGADQLDNAIAQHQEILAGSKHRVASYEALRTLYTETGQVEKANACADALDIIRVRTVADNQRVPTARPMWLSADAVSLTAEDYATVAMGDVDRLLSALFCRVAPVYAGQRARRRLSARSALRESDPRPAAQAFRYVTSSLGISAPAAHVKREQSATCLVSLRQDGGQVAPVLTLGRAAMDTGVDQRALVFDLARRLIDLRSDRVARLLCPRADELTQIVELSMALATADDPAGVADISHTAKWLVGALRPVDLDQLTTIGERLAERATDPEHAALSWLDATERVADRVGYLLTGDLATCVRVLERGPAARSGRHERILDLVWATVTEPMFTVRARLEEWANARHVQAETDHVA